MNIVTVIIIYSNNILVSGHTKLSASSCVYSYLGDENYILVHTLVPKVPRERGELS